MIKLVNVHLSFGGHPLLDGVSWMLGDQDRAGLVGENGSGKTSLLRLMAGLQGFDRGELEISKALRIGYLPQEGVSHQGRTLDQEVRTALAPILRLEEEYKEIEHRLKTDPPAPAEQEALHLRMAELMDQFQLRGGFELEARIGKVLAGLGFSEQDRHRPVEALSGGWQMRIALAKLLLARPQALLLDEPTNHLDLEARNWLEQYLREYPYSYLIVSHDRYFLDVTVNRIVEIDSGGLDDYRGNYSYYLEEKSKKTERALAAYQRQNDEIQRLKAFINKYRADKKRAGQVQSRMKRLEKIPRLEPPRYTAPIHFKFPAPPRGPLEMIRLEGISHGYGDKEVFKDLDLVVTRGEKVAVVGPNGAGKSTLLRLLAGVLKPRAGLRRETDGVHLAYFGQEAGLELLPEDTVMEAISRDAPFDLYPQLRSLLGAFLFSGDDVDKRVKVLSGGERSRLALARLLLRPANLLLMDEPTNHLDLRAKEVLMEAFRRYQGALVFVAHDRYFLEGLPDRVWEVGRGTVVAYPGDYSDYLHAKSREQAPAGAAEEPRSEAGESTPGPTDDGRRDLDKQQRMKKREEQKARKREVQKQKKRLVVLEEEIEWTEGRMEGLAARMAEPGIATDYLKLIELQEEHNRLAAELGQLYGQWEEISRKLPEKEGTGKE